MVASCNAYANKSFFVYVRQILYIRTGGLITSQPYHDHRFDFGLKLSLDGSQAMIVAFSVTAGRQEVSLLSWLIQFPDQVCEWN